MTTTTLTLQDLFSQIEDIAIKAESDIKAKQKPTTKEERKLVKASKEKIRSEAICSCKQIAIDNIKSWDISWVELKLQQIDQSWDDSREESLSIKCTFLRAFEENSRILNVAVEEFNFVEIIKSLDLSVDRDQPWDSEDRIANDFVASLPVWLFSWMKCRLNDKLSFKINRILCENIPTPSGIGFDFSGNIARKVWNLIKRKEYPQLVEPRWQPW